MEVEPDVIDVPMVEAQLEAAPVPGKRIGVLVRGESREAGQFSHNSP